MAPKIILKKGVAKILVLSLVFGLLNWFGPLFPVAHGAALTALSDTMSSVKISSASSHTIKFTSPSGADSAGETIIITFPSDFNFTSKTISTVTFTHGATTGSETTETLAAAASATDWGAAFSGTQNRILTLTAPTDGVGAGAFSAGQKAIVTYNSTNSINATTAGSFLISFSGTFGDTGDITVTLVADDQVAVTATVSQTLTFSISDNSIGFGTLSTTAARFATGDTLGSASEIETHTLTAATNAPSGYTITVTGNTLTNGSYTVTAIGATNSSSATGTEQFGLRMTATGGSGTVSAPYAAAGFALDTAAFPDQVASSSTSSATTTYSARYLANIASTTESGSYTATLTYVATANF